MTAPPRYSRSHTFEGGNPLEDVGNRGRTLSNNSTPMDAPFVTGEDGKKTRSHQNYLYAVILLVVLAVVAAGCIGVFHSSSKAFTVYHTSEAGDVECTGDHGCAHTCIINTGGGFRCECDEGFTTEGGDGFECLVDMCYSGNVLSESRIIKGGEGAFGRSVVAVGDLDGNGVMDLVVGAKDTDVRWQFRRGAVYILFMNADGLSVNRKREISFAQGGLRGPLGHEDYFGISVAALGDLDQDGVADLAVGAYGDDDRGAYRGAVYILFLKTDGSVGREQKISSAYGGLVGPLRDNDQFGYSVAAVGDLDGDTVVDLAVGAIGDDDDGGYDRGAVYILFMHTDGSVKREQKISSTQGGLRGPLDIYDFLGSSVAAVGELDEDGVVDLAVGAIGDNGDRGSDRGAVYILFMRADGSVKAEQKISSTQGGLVGTLHDNDYFGGSVGAVGDLNGDGVVDLAVGAYADDDGGPDRGAVYILLLNEDGTVKREQKISSTTQGPEALVLDDYAFFGTAVTVLGDADGNGVMRLVIGADLANLVYVIEVPPGFVPVCPTGETCMSTADSVYSYECTAE